ncbi:MAG: nucleotidyltransferase domain-containing protein [Candidatus Diapherotrites archaeon]
MKELKKVRLFFSQLKDNRILSVYVYGSILNKNFSKKSDLDLFIILKNSKKPIQTIKSIIKVIKNVKTKRKIYWDIVFEDESKMLYFKKSNIIQYYIIANEGLCIYGKDILKNVHFDLNRYYECVVWIAQKIRHEILNKKTVRFWALKLRRDVMYSILSLQYLEGKKRIMQKYSKKLEKKHPSLKGFQILLNKKQRLETLWYYIESLRVILEQKKGIKFVD